MRLISIIDEIKSFFTRKIKARKNKTRLHRNRQKVVSIYRKARK